MIQIPRHRAATESARIAAVSAYAAVLRVPVRRRVGPPHVWIEANGFIGRHSVHVWTIAGEEPTQNRKGGADLSMTTPTAPRPSIDQEAIRDHFQTAIRRRTPAAIWTALADIPVLLAEVARLALLLTWTRLNFANLLAAARATLAAYRDGEADPLAYLRDELADHDPLPAQDNTEAGER